MFGAHGVRTCTDFDLIIVDNASTNETAPKSAERIRSARRPE